MATGRGRHEPYDPDGDVSRFLDISVPEPILVLSSPLPEQEPVPMPAVEAPSEASGTIGGPVSPGTDQILPFDEREIATIAEQLNSIDVDGETEDRLDQEPVFVRFVRGQLDCSNCVTLREVLHTSETRNLYLVIHGGRGVGTFEHAILDAKYAGIDGQPRRNELYYVDLRQGTHDWVKNFISQCVDRLQSDTSGLFRHSPDFAGDENEYPVKISSQLPTNGDTTADTTPQMNVFPTILESSQAAAGFVAPAPVEAPHLNYPAAAGGAFRLQASYAARPEWRSALAIQRERTANMKIHEVADMLHLPMARAARQPKMCSTALKHVCRKNNVDRWPSRQINAINRQIQKLEQEARAAQKIGGLLTIKEKIDKCVAKRAAIYAAIFNAQENIGDGD